MMLGLLAGCKDAVDQRPVIIPEGIRVDQSGIEFLSEYSEDDPIYTTSRPVALLEITYNDRSKKNCSGVSINKYHIITNYHCVHNSKIDQKLPSVLKIEAYFNFYRREDKIFRYEAYSIPVKYNKDLDYSIIRTKKPISGDFLGARFSAKLPRSKQALRIVHHGGGRQKQVTRFRCRALEAPGRNARRLFLYHDCDTTEGSSGSAILSEATGAIVAIHRGGKPTRLNDEPNQAVLVGAIEADLGNRLASVSSSVLAQSLENSWTNDKPPRSKDQYPRREELRREGSRSPQSFKGGEPAIPSIGLLVAPFFHPARREMIAATIKSELLQNLRWIFRDLESVYDLGVLASNGWPNIYDGEAGFDQIINFKQLQKDNVNAVLVVSIDDWKDGRIDVQFRLFDVLREKQVSGFQLLAARKDAPRVADQIASHIAINSLSLRLQSDSSIDRRTNYSRSAGDYLDLAEGYYNRKEYADAARASLNGYNSDRAGELAARHLLNLGMSLARLNIKTEACLTLAEVRSQFPGSPPSILSKVKKEETEIDCS